MLCGTMLAFSVMASACGNASGSGTTAAGQTKAAETGGNTNAETAASGSDASSKAAAGSASAETVTVRSDGTDLTSVYGAADLNDKWDSGSTEISMNGSSAKISGSGAEYKDGKVVISKAGTYVFSGELTDGQIMIDAEKEAVVHIVLNGAKITSSTSAAIYATKNAKKVIVTLADNTVNELADAKEYTYENADDEEPDAALFVKNDLTFNGGGTLKITANKKAVHTKDSLVILGGAYEISSADDCFKGKDAITAEGGIFDLTVTDTEEGKGMTSEGSVKLYGGTMNIEDSNEGLEGLTVEIYDGSYYIKAEDDGINGREKFDETGMTSQQVEQKKMQNDEKVKVVIAGGLVQVDAKGDGIDSNGSLSLEGGEVYISGPTSNGDGSLDFNGTGTISGGTFLAAGSSGMVQTLNDTSTQNNINVYYDSAMEADSKISVTDADGKEIVSWTPPKKYQCVQISSPDLKTGETYTITAGTDTQQATISGISTTVGTAKGGMGGHGGQGGGPGGGPGMGGQGGPGGKGMRPGSNSSASGSTSADSTDQGGQGQPPQDNGQGGPGGGQAPQGNPPDGNGQAPQGNPPDGGGQPPQGNPPDAVSSATQTTAAGN